MTSVEILLLVLCIFGSIAIIASIILSVICEVKNNRLAANSPEYQKKLMYLNKLKNVSRYLDIFSIVIVFIVIVWNFVRLL